MDEPKTIRESDISQAMNRLQAAAEELGKTYEVVKDRLSPVLSKRVEKDRDPKPERPGMSTPLGESIIQQVEKIDRVIFALQDLRSSIEL